MSTVSYTAESAAEFKHNVRHSDYNIESSKRRSLDSKNAACNCHCSYFLLLQKSRDPVPTPRKDTLASSSTGLWSNNPSGPLDGTVQQGREAKM
jgi:hypothetical protein